MTVWCSISGCKRTKYGIVNMEPYCEEHLNEKIKEKITLKPMAGYAMYEQMMRKARKRRIW